MIDQKRNMRYLLIISLCCVSIALLAQDEDWYLLGKVYPGIEINKSFNLGGFDRFEYGINLILTSRYNLREQLEMDTLLGKNFDLYQFGLFGNYSKTRHKDFFVAYDPNAPNSRDTIVYYTDFGLVKFGFLYNHIVSEKRNIGLSFKISGLSVSNNQYNSFFNNIHLQPEIGVTWKALINIVYGRTIPIGGWSRADLSTNTISLTLRLNPSYIKYRKFEEALLKEEENENYRKILMKN